MQGNNIPRTDDRHGGGRPAAAGIGDIGRTLVVLLALGAGATAAAAQSHGEEPGRLLGRVMQSSGGPVPHAQVTIVGGPSTLTDLNGRFIFSRVAAGTLELSVQALGYAEKRVTEVEILAGGLRTVDVVVTEQAIEVEGISVSAERERGSTVSLLDERRTSHALVEAVGSQEIGRRPDSDAAEVAQRMTGVTVSDGKYVFVRGLGERYSQTSLNGSSLPSPEPEREVVPLDLFPSGFLESLTMQKTYTPDLPADFSGGAVQIETKDFPSRFQGRLSVSTSANTESQFRNDFLHYAGGSLDWLGVDDGSRAEPEALQHALGDVFSGRRLPTDGADLVALGEALRNTGVAFSPRAGPTPLNRSLDLSLGGRADVGERSELGYFFAGTYADRYSIGASEVERKWRASAFREETAELSEPNVDYTFTHGRRNVSWGTIGNVAFRVGPDHQVALRTTINLNADDEARRYVGTNREDIGGTVRSERARFVERLMTWAQLSGEHIAPFGSRLDWRVTGARATRLEPMLREALYLLDERVGEFRLLDETESARYFSSGLVDDDLSGELDARLPFDLLGREAAVELGGAVRARDRDFGARRLNWRFLGNRIPDLDTALDTGEIVAGAPSGGEFALSDVVEPGDVYQVDDTRLAGYAMLDLPLTDRLDGIVGARVERYSLQLVSRDRTLQDLEQTELAPSLSLVYSPTSHIKVRGAVSRTLDRPEFRELAPFQFTEATSLRQLVGNPDLVPASITSGDVRVDWFWGPRELVSVGAFYKEMSNPIEQVFIAAASTAYSFQNAESATVRGIETDVQLRLGRVHDALRHFGLQANYSWIRSNVRVRSGGIYQPTNAERPLQGQAPYVVNVGLTYADLGGLEVGLHFNRFGERLTAAGGSGLPDIYEQPRNVLDASFGFPLRGGIRAKVKGSNLLDSEHLYLQEANGFSRTQRRYAVGRTISVGLAWEF